MCSQRTNEWFYSEWKENHDLFKYHEDLKQKRFSYFISIQTALIALTGVLTRLLYNDSDSSWFVLNLISIFALLIAYVFRGLDSRARDYVDTVKGKLLSLERAWNKEHSKQSFSTYTEQFEILVHKRNIDKYLLARGLGNKDRMLKIVNKTGNSAAHILEEKLFHIFIGLWIVVFIGALCASLI